MSSESADAEPWARYHRMPLRVGWSFPVNQSEVRQALLVAGVTVDEVTLFHFPDAEERAAVKAGRVRLLWAEWTGRSSELWIYAVPSEVRGQARRLMLGSALTGAISWLARLPSRGNAWEATRHRWDGLMVDGAFLTQERDAYFPAAGSGIGAE